MMMEQTMNKLKLFVKIDMETGWFVQMLKFTSLKTWVSLLALSYHIY